MQRILCLSYIIISFYCQGLYASNKDSVRQVIDLMPDAFLEKIEEQAQAQIFDVRDFRQLTKYIIAGAVHAPSKKVLESYVHDLEKETPLFVYCDVGFSSAQAARILTEWGFTEVYNLSKGINYWKKKGYPTEKRKRHGKKKDE